MGRTKSTQWWFCFEMLWESCGCRYPSTPELRLREHSLSKSSRAHIATRSNVPDFSHWQVYCVFSLWLYPLVLIDCQIQGARIFRRPQPPHTTCASQISGTMIDFTISPLTDGNSGNPPKFGAYFSWELVQFVSKWCTVICHISGSTNHPATSPTDAL